MITLWGTNTYHRLSHCVLFNLGIRLYVDDMAPDEREAKALMYNNHYVDVYSNSWGPGDRGFEVRGPGYETQRALRVGATKVTYCWYFHFRYNVTTVTTGVWH